MSRRGNILDNVLDEMSSEEYRKRSEELLEDAPDDALDVLLSEEFRKSC